MNNIQFDFFHWTELARQIATDAHKNQFRKDGITPYISHVLAVADKVEYRLKPIALAHDLIEDTNITLQDLTNAGFPSYITDAVALLTHNPLDSNEIYWNKILTNQDALAVKIADITHNLSDNPSDSARIKYMAALELFYNKSKN